ncbi:hypothetical protein DES36_105161 [Alkalibaculum bacchi]|uniref:Uncharacterized protein n=2 Tax=Alkalibaculum bacchi TaxID=645887 RepID=A0A366IA74_9FIRM|nr:hypothetical protein [Alkalibaculum bacchi]RBP66776.1 hypothetical protein DES36_105161 [Alkalibaculum bacchi]
MISINKIVKIFTLLFIVFVMFVGCGGETQESIDLNNSLETINSKDSPNFKNVENPEEPLDSVDSEKVLDSKNIDNSSEPLNSKDGQVENLTEEDLSTSDKEAGKNLIIGEWMYVKEPNDEYDYIMMITNDKILIGQDQSEWFFKYEYEIVDYDESNKTVQLLAYEIEEIYGSEEKPQLLEPSGIDVYKVIDNILYVTDFNGEESQWKKN